MARIEDNVTVKITTSTNEVVYAASRAEIAGWGGKGYETLGITLRNYKNISQGTFQRDERALCDDPKDEERKKLIASHASVLTDVLKAAETTKLNSAIKRERMEQEIAAQERADRIAMMFAVNNAIQAGLSEEEVTADMCDGWASYVCDMYGHVYTATDLDTVVNKK